MSMVTRREALMTRAGLAALVVVLWGHGLFLAARDPWPGVLVHGRAWELLSSGLGSLGVAPAAASSLIGGVAGALVVLVLAVLAGGIDGLRPIALIAPLLTVLSPTFARGILIGGEWSLVAALLVAGGYRAFAETHTAGRLPISALLFGAAAGLGHGGLAVLILVCLQKLIFARKFRLGGQVYLFAGIWLVLGLITAGLVHLLVGSGGGGPVPDASLLAAGGQAGIWRILSAFWREVDGLAILPFLLVLLFGWKPKAVFFRLTLVASILVGWMTVGSRAPASALPFLLVPALPFAFLIVGGALEAAGSTLEAVGLRGRARAGLVSLCVLALALGQLWPSLVLAFGKSYQ
jgi:hypothetical protein